MILILRLQIHEIVKIQNSVMNQQVILLQEICKSFQIQESVLLFQKVQNIDYLLRLISINVERKQQLLQMSFASDGAEENMLSVML